MWACYLPGFRDWFSRCLQCWWGKFTDLRGKPDINVSKCHVGVWHGTSSLVSSSPLLTTKEDTFLQHCQTTRGSFAQLCLGCSSASWVPPSGNFPPFLLRTPFENTLSPLCPVRTCLAALIALIVLFLFTSWTLPPKCSSSKMGMVIPHCVLLAHSRHLNLLRWSELNWSCIIFVGVCLGHPSSFLTGLTHLLCC